MESRLAAVEHLISQNNQNHKANELKDREKAATYKGELDLIQKDFEEHIAVNPEGLKEVVSTEMQNALIRMTEKKLLADQKCQQLEQKVFRLEELVQQLQAENDMLKGGRRQTHQPPLPKN